LLSALIPDPSPRGRREKTAIPKAPSPSGRKDKKAILKAPLSLWERVGVRVP
jgi:hypothetical protein